MDVEHKTPMRKDAIFRMASMSKPVTGVAILMLLEEGRIRLNDPVSKFIPEFKDTKVAIEKPQPAGASLWRRPRPGGARDRDLHRAGQPRDHDSRSDDAHLRPRKRRRRYTRRQPHRTTRYVEQSRRIHSEAGRRAARLPAGHRSGATARSPASRRSAGSSRSSRA